MQTNTMTLNKIPIPLPSAIEIPTPIKQMVPKTANSKKKPFMFETPSFYVKKSVFLKVL